MFTGRGELHPDVSFARGFQLAANPLPLSSLVFTTYYGGLVNVLTNQVGLAVPPTAGVQQLPIKVVQFQAIWDTGATGTVITKKAAADLGLSPTGQTVTIGVHGPKQVNTYIVNLHLPNKTTVDFVEVTECDALSSDGSSHILIGMNVIGLGDFAVTNRDGKTVMTFCMPSIRRIDFVEEYNKNPTMPAGLNREQKRQWEKKHKKK